MLVRNGFVFLSKLVTCRAWFGASLSSCIYNNYDGDVCWTSKKPETMQVNPSVFAAGLALSSVNLASHWTVVSQPSHSLLFCHSAFRRLSVFDCGWHSPLLGSVYFLLCSWRLALSSYLSLLRWDTVNWSNIAARAHEEFCNLCAKLEHMVCDGHTIHNIFRPQLYRLCGARSGSPQLHLAFVTCI